MALKRIKDWLTSITSFRTGDVIPVDGPSGTAKMPKDSLLELAAKKAPTTYTDSAMLNSVIKELYFGNLTKAQIESIDNVVLFNGFNNLYGLVFKAGSTTISSMTKSTAFDVDTLTSILTDGGTCIIDLSLAEDNIHPVITCRLSEACINLNYSPTIAKSVYEKSWGLFNLSRPLIISNSAKNPSDLNDLKESGVYVVQRTADTTTANFPSDFPTDGTRCTLEVYKNDYSTTYISLQLITKVGGYDKWWRVYNLSSGVWSAWEKVSLPTPVFPSLAQYMEVEQYQLYGDYATNPADLNSLTDNCILLIQRTAATTTTNFPDGFPTDGSRHLLEVYQTTFSDTTKTAVQVLSSIVGTDKWWRVYNLSSGVWSAWSKVQTIQTKEFHVGSGYPYTTIRSAVEAATALQNSKVIIHNGTYDLLTEFADKFTDLFSGTKIGLELKNGVHIFAHDGVKITANVPDDGTYTDEQLSKFGELFNPFYPTTNGSFTLENINIEAMNTRYCVHDEHGGAGTYYSKYINCKMKFTNTISRSGIAKFVACIGGGLGLHGTIVVEGGRYESHTVNGAGHIGGGDPENHQNCISYHNGDSATCDSSIRITGVYLADRGYIKFGYYGPSTIKSFCEVSDCSLGLPLVIGKETNDDAPANYDVVSWGNEQKVEGVHWEVGSDGYTQNLVADS